jgi:hypothetical protein
VACDAHVFARRIMVWRMSAAMQKDFVPGDFYQLQLKEIFEESLPARARPRFELQ